MRIREFKEIDTNEVKHLIEEIVDREFSLEHGVYKYNDLKDIPFVYGGNRNHFFVGIEDDHVVSTVAVKEDEKGVALLRRLFVGKNCRQKGYGDKMLRKALKFAKESGYKKIVFRCTNRMVAAINLTLKEGFVEKDIIDMKNYKIFLLEKKLA